MIHSIWIWVYTNVGLMYMCMHCIHNQPQTMVSMILPLGMKIIILVTYIWCLVGVSRWENLVHPSCYLGQYHFKTRLIPRRVCLGMKILVWYINLNIFIHINNRQLPVPYWNQNLKLSLKIPKCYQNKPTSDEHHTLVCTLASQCNI